MELRASAAAAIGAGGLAAAAGINPSVGHRSYVAALFVVMVVVVSCGRRE